MAQTHGMMSNPPCLQQTSGGARNEAVTNGDKLLAKDLAKNLTKGGIKNPTEKLTKGPAKVDAKTLTRTLAKDHTKMFATTLAKELAEDLKWLVDKNRLGSTHNDSKNKTEAKSSESKDRTEDGESKGGCSSGP